MKILVALGGNAIKRAEEKGTTQEQFQNCNTTALHLTQLIKKMDKDDKLIITHGNGPQAGNLLFQQVVAEDQIPSQSMDVVGAMTQGQIGYMLQQTLINNLKKSQIPTPVIGVINQVLVDRADPEFKEENMSKPVGNFFTKREAEKMKTDHPNFIFKKVKPLGEKSWRRVVPSPTPLSNIEEDTIKKLVDSGVIVIASGGGGIPVILNHRGEYKGVEAVIDKDLAGEKLAEAINADVFVILTNIESVMLHFGSANQQPIYQMTLEDANRYFDEGHFLPGSMGPKVKACIRFIEKGGKKAIITSLETVSEAIEGKTGTRITLN